MARRKARWENIPRAGTITSMANELGCTNTLKRAVSEFVSERDREKFWNVPVVWNRNCKTTAGYYIGPIVKINKNTKELSIDLSREHIELHPGLTLAEPRHLYETFLHECAHGIQRWAEIRFKRSNKYYRFESSHGPIWGDIMLTLGLMPKRTHRIPEALQKAAVHITPGGKVIDPTEGLDL